MIPQIERSILPSPVKETDLNEPLKAMEKGRSPFFQVRQLSDIDFNKYDIIGLTSIEFHHPFNREYGDLYQTPDNGFGWTKYR